MTSAPRQLHKREEAFLQAVSKAAQLSTIEFVQLRKRVMEGGLEAVGAALTFTPPISELVVISALQAIGTPIADILSEEPDEDGLTPASSLGRRVLASSAPLAEAYLNRAEYVAYLPASLTARKDPVPGGAGGEVRSVVEALHRMGKGNIKPGELGIRQIELLLLSTGRITDDHLARARALHKRLRHVDLRAEPPALDVHAALSARVIDDFRVLPWKREHGRLIVLTSNPYPTHLKGTVEDDAGESVELAVASESAIQAAIQERYHNKKVFDDLRADSVRGLPVSPPTPALADDADSSVIHAVNSIIETAVQKKASDIHLQPSEQGLSVRLRVNGRLIAYQELPQDVAPQLLTRVKLMADMKVEQRDLPQDKRIHYQHGHVDVILRVNTLRVSGGLERIVMRLNPRNRPLPGLGDLNLQERNRAVLEEALTLREGMILMTGPTGSGKTTTTYAMLARLNTPEVNIQTLEQPVEYDLPGITQTSVNPEAQSIERRLDYDRALEALMRQDPDVLMVGEIHTAKTATIAAQAALTGHLVISTLRAGGAVATVRRLLDLGLEPFTVADTLRVVISQRLAGRPCQACAVEVPAPERYFPHARGQLILKSVGRVDEHGRGTLMGGASCPHCDGTGLSGRVAVHEVLRVTPAVQQAISQNASGQVIARLAREDGMQSLLEDGLAKVLAREATLESLLSWVRADPRTTADQNTPQKHADSAPVRS